MLIGIVGQKGAGKDTIADLLVKEGYIAEKKAVADGIRIIRDMLFKDYLEDDATSGSNGRGSLDTKILQDIGRAMRTISEERFGHKYIWLNYLFKLVKHSAVISDIRLPIEAQYIIVCLPCASLCHVLSVSPYITFFSIKEETWSLL